eukprot:SAG31_NODE_30556_length_379_cov_0.978571_1_plen_31_part_01
MVVRLRKIKGIDAAFACHSVYTFEVHVFVTK